MSLFASTSPSYLILRSLDALNAILAEEYPRRLAAFTARMERLRERLQSAGYSLVGDEPLKLTIRAKAYGYFGAALGELLAREGIVCEFCDRDYLTLMLTPALTEDELSRLEQVLCGIPKKSPIEETPPRLPVTERGMTIREAMLTVGVEREIFDCEGMILADAALTCPPAVPILVCGERITVEAIACFRYYGISRVRVISPTEKIPQKRS